MSASIIAIAAKLACGDIYDPIAPGVFGKIYRVGETTCGTALINSIFYIICQGTENMAGWRADFDAVPIRHPVLGMLHSGFDRNLPELVRQLLPDIPLTAQVVVGGHSKGAGEGSILAARLKLAGINVVQCVLFACPNSGYQEFADWLKTNINGYSFRNAPKSVSFMGDPVPLVPVDPNQPPYPHTQFTATPAGLSRFINLNWHRGEYYEQGVTALYA